MANALYTKAREKLLKGEIAWLADTIRAVLVDLDDYPADLATNEFLSDVPAIARATNGISPPFANKTADNGVADAGDVVLTAVTGDPSEAILIYKDTGGEATSPLIAFIDTAAGLPVTPSGGDVTVAWDNGPDRIFRV